MLLQNAKFWAFGGKFWMNFIFKISLNLLVKFWVDFVFKCDKFTLLRLNLAFA